MVVDGSGLVGVEKVEGFLDLLLLLFGEFHSLSTLSRHSFIFVGSSKEIGFFEHLNLNYEL
mgnify:CR=1 FL=1